ncbi:ATP-binding cassette domain-containing protein [Gordonia pseudamarae]|uniref:ATP-binding cassette domain-containing protein n=1 Tax=Gordonia pseudamarae TaxID=2831662 RepID=A0ABX6IFB3_9ACTN|nr:MULTISPECIES: ABC-F family ATP-binding cassette domain-containing protein [Gordonia]MBD0023364.1 ABC-F family ATP-binding cassette domain-containing protein [Gordonia sp. (in: high G+C Gram-positive bacteria)]QHN25598.1 ATP-binding cassette domain-containing protein [Gordonia pseudamarae]QHN34530.1 ATP-binding cassette domain-containing protein [Gordonia pseudamarae]
MAPSNPTALINADRISKSFGIKQLLDSVSLGVHEGQRIGVVGLNGGGKTTLLEILGGITEPDSGRVSRAGDIRVETVTQRGDLPAGATVAEVVVGGPEVAVYEWAGDARVRAILAGIGIDGLLDRRVDELSGGQRRRVGLATALISDADLLILDEPTNHLDIEGVQWLADHLVSRRSALIVVTHDRWFLDTVATRTWEVHSGRVDEYEGGYNDWIFARAERVRLDDAAEERRRNLARKELAWLRRGPPARTSKPRYRIEAAEKLIADVPPPRDTVTLSSFARRRLGRVVIELENAHLETPGGVTLLDDLTWRLAPGERVGLVGVNGSGKTTLLRVLAGQVAGAGDDADGARVSIAPGRRIEGTTVKIGWLRQELDDLDEDQRVLDAVEDVAGRIMVGDKEMSAAQLAERLGFSPAKQRTPVRDLSGGERRRLQLTRVLMAEPNVLLLDEPTNDLDIDTLQQVEDILDSWAGTLVVISHDRYLIERICDSTWALFGDGKLTNLPGGIEQYLHRRRELAANEAKSTVKQAVVESDSSQASTVLSAAEHRETRKTMNRLERQIEQLSAKEDKLHADLAAAATDPGKLVTLGAELKSVVEQKDTAEAQWLELAELMD